MLLQGAKNLGEYPSFSYRASLLYLTVGRKFPQHARFVVWIRAPVIPASELPFDVLESAGILFERCRAGLQSLPHREYLPAQGSVSGFD